MKRIAVFPGSFDPFTTGHEAIVLRAAPLFDKIIVAIGHNSQKNYMYNLEQRLNWIDDIFKDINNVEVASYEGLTINFCKEENAKFILRGVRNGTDFEYEKNIGQMNKEISEGIETVLLITDPEFTHISSSLVREIVKNNGDAKKYVPAQINL